MLRTVSQKDALN
uniref:Uncharacterized protein n=1 Tax=Arundo donax TaxID=35708 RepID=A0A0A9BVG9_ARUDO